MKFSIYAAGNLVVLDDEIASVFGARLVPADTVTFALPRIAALRGKIMCLLPGDTGTRLGYRRDLGFHPAVAIMTPAYSRPRASSTEPRLREVHRSESRNQNWFWLGTLVGTEPC